MTFSYPARAAGRPGALLRRAARLFRPRTHLPGVIGVLAIVAAACTNAIVGGTAPPVNVQTFEHGEFSLDTARGKAVVVNFWFPSCPPCRAELPDLQAAYEEHEDDIEFIGVQLLGQDSAEEGARFLQDLGITYPAGPDEKDEIWQAYKVTGFPTTVFLDRDHDVVKSWTGILDAERLEEFIQKALES